MNYYGVIVPPQTGNMLTVFYLTVFLSQFCIGLTTIIWQT